MLFSNLSIYKFTRSVDLTALFLTEKLSEHLFAPCTSQELSSTGWVSPLGRQSDQLVHESNGYFMLCSKRQEKILPASVVNEFLEEQVFEIESTESRKVSRKERQSIKEEIIFGLTVKALARSSLLYAYISLRDNMLVINSASEKRSEDFITDLREALGSLSVIPLEAKSLPIDLMTTWVSSGETSDNFVVGEDNELRDNADISSIVRCKNQNLASAEVLSYVRSGMHVSKLELTWNERVEFILDEKLAIRRLRFTDIIHEKIDEAGSEEDIANLFNVDFVIMTLELSHFIAALMSALGGENE
jgi:recombination associated protein RdgC